MSKSHCSCTGGTCLSCACAKAGRGCSSSCHGGGANLQCLAIRLASGVDVNKMTAQQVKVELIKRGLYNLDDTGPQLKALLLRTLADEERSTAGVDDIDDDDGSGGGGSSADGGVDAVALARHLLRVAGDDLAVLNALQSFPRVAASVRGSAITAHTPASAAKKVFRFMAALVHPDKLQRKFDKATQAFQALVSAYDHLCQGGVASSMSAGRGRASGGSGAIDLTLTRSNAGCYTTPVKCPRCRVDWNQPADGLEKFAFTIFMCGLQSFHCSTCLLDFGCITAIHRCPHCRSAKSEYHYSPDDFNRHLVCGNKSCGKQFGFTLTVIPPRRMRELADSLKTAQEQRNAAHACKESRGERASKRRAQEEDEAVSRNAKKSRSSSDPEAAVADLTEEEQSFVIGLVDSCPRCGFTPRGSPDEAALLAHLHGCTDAKKHAAHERRVRQQQERDATRATRRQQEADSQSTQVWKFLGASKETSWLLTDGAVKQQLRLQGEEEPSDASNRRHRMQQRMAAREATALLKESDDASDVDHDGSATALVSRPVAAALSAASLPTNLHRCTRAQLVSVLRAHDLHRGDEDHLTKDRLIDRIEAARDQRPEEEDDGEHEKRTTRAKKRVT